MKKSILNIGKTLNKAEQKNIFGGNLGFAPPCDNSSGNSCDPNAGQAFGNPACNIGEVCVGYDPTVYLNGDLVIYGYGVCECS